MKSFDELMVELSEKKTVSLATRRKMARRMAKLTKSSAFKAKVARKRLKLATPDMLHKRALKQAKEIILKKFANVDRKAYMELTPAQRIELDNRITSKKGPAIQKIAKKLLVKLKKQELERLKKVKSGGDE